MSRTRLVLITLLLALVPTPAGAAGPGAGTTLFALQIGQGTGDFVNPEREVPGYISISRDTRGQVEGSLEIWHLFSDDYALAVSGAAGFFREENKPGTNAAPANLHDVRFTARGLRFRVGGDRVGSVGGRFTLFAGPGLEYWSGNSEYEGIYSPLPSKVKSATTHRFGLSGRVGALIQLSAAFGLSGQVGTSIGYASAEDAGARATWFPVGFQSAWGLTYTFGEE